MCTFAVRVCYPEPTSRISTEKTSSCVTLSRCIVSFRIEACAGKCRRRWETERKENSSWGWNACSFSYMIQRHEKILRRVLVMWLAVYKGHVKSHYYGTVHLLSFLVLYERSGINPSISRGDDMSGFKKTEFLCVFA